MNTTMPATITDSLPQRTMALGSLSFDWLAAFFSAWIVSGLYLDGWAHEHGKVDNTFFTPWHGILYAGVFLMLAFLAINQVNNMRKGYPWQNALPAGYRLSLAGAALFLIGGGLDLAWHSLFGFEVDLETLLSPSHLLLATSGVLMISGPVRAAWQQERLRVANNRQDFWPIALSLALVLSILTFFTQFAHPFRSIFAGKPGPDSQGRNEIYRMNADGSTQTRLTVNPKLGGWGAAMSPDGTQIAFSAIRGDSPDIPAEIYLMNADGSGWQQLTRNQRINFFPTWSPDGTQIAFLSQQGSQVKTSDIYVINTDGSGERNLTNTTSQEYGISWSPDGEKIVFGSNQGGAWGLYTMNPDGSQQAPLTAAGVGNAPSWSPDGTRIAFNSERNGTGDIFAINADGSDLRQLASGEGYNSNPFWSPDGSRIAYSSSLDGHTNIFVMSADGNNPTNLSQDTGAWNGVPTWTPDGSILYTIQENPARPSGQFKSMGVTSVLLQTAFLMGVILLAVRHGRLPVGALAVIIFLNNALMTVLHDNYKLLPAALLAGILAEVLLWWIKPEESQPRFALFAFSVPLVLYGLYYLNIQLTQGIGWTIHLWLGSMFMAGIIGMFVSFLLVSPLKAESGQRLE